MDGIILPSKIFLGFENMQIESNYLKVVSETRVKYNFKCSQSLLIISIINLIIINYLQYYSEEEKNNLKYLNYLLLTCYLLNIITCKITKNENTHKYLFYFYRVLLSIAFMNVRILIKGSGNIILPIINSIEIIVEIGVVFNGMSELRDEFMITIINFFIISFYTFLFEKLEFFLYYCIDSALFIILALIITWNRRKCFLLQNGSHKEITGSNQLIEAINSGFIGVKNDVITYMNEAMIKGLYRIDSVRRIIRIGEQEQRVLLDNDDIIKSVYMKFREKSEEVLNELLNYCNETDKFEHSGNGTKNNYVQIKKDMERKFKSSNDNSSYGFSPSSKSNNCNNFTHLGTKSFALYESKDVVTYEIICRFCRISSLEDSHKSSADEDRLLEFIFNDVSKERMFREKDQEEENKTLIHSKIAHEFKNPLITVNELVDQVLDFLTKEATPLKPSFSVLPKIKHYSVNLRLKKTQKKIINKILPQIKSMCNYLLILINDFAFFSMEYLNNLKVEKNQCDLEELLVLCEDIAKVILKKLGKSSAVKFKIKRGKGLVEKLYTDEAKLKQILSNLISNAVKFTDRGKITLEVSMSDENSDLNNAMITFKITETGAGIDKERSSRGVGLKIIELLTKIIGNGIKSTSVIGEGSSFWFSIKNEQEINITKEDAVANQVSRPPTTDAKSLIKNIESDENITIKESKEGINPRRKNSLFSGDLGNFNLVMEDLNSSTDTVGLEDLVLINPLSKTVEYENFLKSEFDYFLSHLKSEDSHSLSSPSSSDDEPFSSHENISQKIKTYNIIIADDEELVRVSIRRLIETIASSLSMKVNIIEAGDGVETIHFVYLCLTKGMIIHCILSDENIIYLKGSQSAFLISKLITDKSFRFIPFYIVTSYEDAKTLSRIKNNSIIEILTKPLKKNFVEKVLNAIKNEKIQLKERTSKM